MGLKIRPKDSDDNFVNIEKMVETSTAIGKSIDMRLMYTEHYKKRINHVRNFGKWIGFDEWHKMLIKTLLSYIDEFRCSTNVKYLVHDTKNGLNMVIKKGGGDTLKFITIFRSNTKGVVMSDNYDKLLTV